jgi:hypothetical protein
MVGRSVGNEIAKIAINASPYIRTYVVRSLPETAPAAGAVEPRLAQRLKTTKIAQTAPERYPESFVVIV